MALARVLEQIVHSMARNNHFLAERLPALIKASGKSEAAVAKAIGIGSRAFNNYVKGREPEDVHVTDRIADYFETSRAYLLGYTNDPTPPSSPTSTDHVQRPLTSGQNNGQRHSKEAIMVESELMRSLLNLNNEMIALRQDIRRLNDRLTAVETEGRSGPRKGRRAKF